MIKQENLLSQPTRMAEETTIKAEKSLDKIQKSRLTSVLGFACEADHVITGLLNEGYVIYDLQVVGTPDIRGRVLVLYTLIKDLF